MLRFVSILVFSTSCCVLLLLTACCVGGIDDMVLRVSIGPDHVDMDCRSDLLLWNDVTMATTQDAVIVNSNGAGRGEREDWIQIFDETGVRVPIAYFAEREHSCEGGCPGTKHYYPFPAPGTYTLVHFRDDGRSTDDDQLIDYMGQRALVTTLVIE